MQNSITNSIGDFNSRLFHGIPAAIRIRVRPFFFFIFPGRSGEAGFSAQRRVKEDGQSFAFNVVPIMYASTVPNHELT